MLVVRIWLASSLSAVSEVSLLVGTVNDEAAPRAKDSKPFANYCARFFEIFENMRRIDVVEHVIPKPTEILSITAELNEAFPYGRVR